MSTTPLPLFLDSAHREDAIKKHPRLWKRFLALCAEQNSLTGSIDDQEYGYSLEDQKDVILKKMGLD
jgi:hypothetical protein